MAKSKNKGGSTCAELKELFRSQRDYYSDKWKKCDDAQMVNIGIGLLAGFLICKVFLKKSA